LETRANPDQNIALPNTRAFIVTKDSPQQVMLQRNPYLFMVDTEGNQLPYVDYIMLDRVADRSLLDPKIVGGQYDFAGFQTTIQNYTTYQDAAEQGGFKLVLWRSGKGSDVVYNVNMNWPDDMVRGVFSDVRFRRALSLAINREGDQPRRLLWPRHAPPNDGDPGLAPLQDRVRERLARL
jgi:peptide/nickel transport system substrate-binding protein